VPGYVRAAPTQPHPCLVRNEHVAGISIPGQRRILWWLSLILYAEKSQTTSAPISVLVGRGPGLTTSPRGHKRTPLADARTALHVGPCSECRPADELAARAVLLRSSCLLSPEQIAPYVALCGCTVTIVSESSAYCGQAGRVCRIFWRPEPWALVRLRSGVLLALPWSWTNLPQPKIPSSSDRPAAALLSPSALRDLVRFLRNWQERPEGSQKWP